MSILKRCPSYLGVGLEGFHCTPDNKSVLTSPNFGKVSDDILVLSCTTAARIFENWKSSGFSTDFMLILFDQININRPGYIVMDQFFKADHHITSARLLNIIGGISQVLLTIKIPLKPWFTHLSALNSTIVMSLFMNYKSTNWTGFN